MDYQRIQKSEPTPLLRFPAHRQSGDWETKLLRQIATLHKGRGVSKADISAEGRQRCIRYGELYTIYGEVIDEVVSATHLPASALFLSKKNDVIIPASGETKIDIATASCVTHDGVALGSDLNIVRTNENGIFLSYYFNGALKNTIAKLAQGDAVVHLHQSQLELLSIPLPSHREQRNIAECLSSIDELIAVEGRKLSALMAHKKGLLQQLLPAEGETTPRLRFPEFRATGEWQEAVLSSRIHLVSGLHLLPGDYGMTGEVPYFTGPTDFTNQQVSATKWTNKSENTAAKDDTLITVKGSGVGQLWNLQLSRVAIGRQLMAVRARESSDLFLYQVLTTRSVRFRALASGNLIPGLSRSDILNMKFMFPSIAEQDRIAGCLSGMDSLTDAVAKRVAALKTHKKGLMQQLFPVLDEAQA